MQADSGHCTDPRPASNEDSSMDALRIGACWIVLAGLAAAQFPDLTITEIDVVPPNPAAGQSVTVTVTAENIGNSEPLAEPVCYLYHNSAAVPSQCAFNQLQDLQVPFPPNSQRFFTFTVQYPAAGTYRLWAWMDACE